MRVLVSFVLLLAATAALGVSDSLTLSLFIDRAVSTSREAVDLTLVLHNTSTQALIINRRLAYPGPDLMLEIVDAQGVRLRWLPPAAPPPFTRSDFVRLDPGEEFHLKLPDVGRHLFDKFEPGRDYQVRAIYRNEESGSQWHYAAWIGSLESRPITFRWGG
jgi:hypothetical protein